MAQGMLVKTQHGHAEIERRSAGLDMRLRRLLILVDGKRSLADLAKMSGIDEVEPLVERLRQAGLIAPRESISAQAPPSAPDTDPALATVAALPERDGKSLGMARNFMFNTLRTFNGNLSKLSLQEAVHKCPDHATLRSLYPAWAEAINETTMGRRRFPELQQQLFAVL